MLSLLKSYATSVSTPDPGSGIYVFVHSGRVLLKWMSWGIFIERWIHDRGPSFDSPNVIDALRP